MAKQQNHKFSFYSLLFGFFRVSRFPRHKAEQLIQMSLKYKDLTLEKLDMEQIKKWYKDYYSDEILDASVDITRHCFVDLVHQIRNEAVQKLFSKWKALSETDKDVFVHVHAVISRGGLFGESRTISDNHPLYLKYLDDFGAVGMVHRSWFDENGKLCLSA
jgi:hypothetical protein